MRDPVDIAKGYPVYFDLVEGNRLDITTTAGVTTANQIAIEYINEAGATVGTLHVTSSMCYFRNRPNKKILVPDWLITSNMP